MRTSIVVWTGVALLGVSTARASETSDLRAIGAGRALYLSHCASCHGPRGLGTAAEMNRVGMDAPDLTLIGQRDGDFKAVHVMHHVLNRGGKAPMPRWARVLERDNNGVPAQLDVYHLVRYLEYLQRADQYAALADTPATLP